MFLRTSYEYIVTVSLSPPSSKTGRKKKKRRRRRRRRRRRPGLWRRRANRGKCHGDGGKRRAALHHRGKRYIYVLYVAVKLCRMTDEIDHDLHIIYQILACRSEVLCRICMVQIQPGEDVLDYADCTATTRQRELRRRSQQIRDLSALRDLRS